MFKIIKKADIVLFVLLLVLGIALSVPGFVSAFGSGDSNLAVEIRVSGELMGSYDLSQNQEIPIKDGEHLNKVIIKDGRVQMVEASCHNQLCVKQGEISRPGQAIICLPNRVTVETRGGANSSGGDPDVISG